MDLHHPSTERLVNKIDTKTELHCQASQGDLNFYRYIIQESPLIYSTSPFFQAEQMKKPLDMFVKRSNSANAPNWIHFEL